MNELDEITGSSYFATYLNSRKEALRSTIVEDVQSAGSSACKTFLDAFWRACPNEQERHLYSSMISLEVASRLVEKMPSYMKSLFLDDDNSMELTSTEGALRFIQSIAKDSNGYLFFKGLNESKISRNKERIILSGTKTETGRLGETIFEFINAKFSERLGSDFEFRKIVARQFKKDYEKE